MVLDWRKCTYFCSSIMIIFSTTPSFTFIAARKLRFEYVKRKFNFLYFLNHTNFVLVILYFMLTLSVVIGFFLLGIDQFLKRTFDHSTFIEEHYVDGRDISIQFPENKRNLILIYLESMENVIS